MPGELNLRISSASPRTLRALPSEESCRSLFPYLLLVFTGKQIDHVEFLPYFLITRLANSPCLEPEDISPNMPVVRSLSLVTVSDGVVEPFT